MIVRRTVLGMAAAATAFPILGRAAESPALAGIKAMTFDIQGTVFDYYRPFSLISDALAARKGLSVNWSIFLADWNARATSIILATVAGKRSWLPPGQVFSEALDGVLAAHGLTDRIDEGDRMALLSVWSLMSPWPDSLEGLTRFRRKFTVAALTNAGMATVVAIVKRGGLSFDAVFTGDIMRSYKPAPEVYQTAAADLGLRPEEVMMVAAHKFDLKAAKAAGLKTAYIPRPLEFGPETKVDRASEDFIDIVAADFIDLSNRIGAA